jgi:hypothetical protein
MVAEGFTITAYSEMLIIETMVEALLRRFATYQPPPRKWLRTDAAARP